MKWSTSLIIWSGKVQERTSIGMEQKSAVLCVWGVVMFPIHCKLHYEQ